MLTSVNFMQNELNTLDTSSPEGLSMDQAKVIQDWPEPQKV